MKQKILFLFLLFSSLKADYLTSQNLKFSEIEAMSHAPDFFFKKNVDYSLRTYDSVYFKSISRPFDSKGLLAQQFTLPVLENYLNEVDVDVLYYFDSVSVVDEQVVFHSTKDLEEIKIQLSIKELYNTSQYFDYLILRGQRSSNTAWDDIAVSVGLNPNRINNFKNSTAIEPLLLNSYQQTELFKDRNKDYLELFGENYAFYEMNSNRVDGAWYFRLKQRQKRQ